LIVLCAILAPRSTAAPSGVAQTMIPSALDASTGATGAVGVPVLADGCNGPLTADDGTVESGYGWVPSVKDGIYVQQFDGALIDNRVLGEVCVCWLRTRDDDTIDFEVVAYEPAEPPAGDPTAPLRPDPTPYGTVSASAQIDSPGVAGAQLVRVDLNWLRIPPGPFFLGVRWNPSRDGFFFLCADQGPDGDASPLFFRDDRARSWENALTTRDPIFKAHHAAVIRPVQGLLPAAADVPSSSAVLWALTVLLAMAGIFVLRR
jgi:hypothetical protein